MYVLVCICVYVYDVKLCKTLTLRRSNRCNITKRDKILIIVVIPYRFQKFTKDQRSVMGFVEEAMTDPNKK